MKFILTILIAFLFQFQELQFPKYEVAYNDKTFPDSLVSIEYHPPILNSCNIDYHELTIFLSGSYSNKIVNVPCEYIQQSKIMYINISDNESQEARMSVNNDGAVYWVGKRDVEVWRRSKNSILFVLD